jgi:hypothetical protein
MYYYLYRMKLEYTPSAAYRNGLLRVRWYGSRILVFLFPAHRLAPFFDAHAAYCIRYRYDARLLLDALPPFSANIVDHTEASNNDNAPAPAPAQAPFRADSPTPSGWSDLPSDAEDTFFLTPEETTDLHRTKRLRHFDALRTARLRALSPDATNNTGADVNADADPWGDSDEEVKKNNNCIMTTCSSSLNSRV